MDDGNEERSKRLCRKMDLHILPVVALLYLFCFLDRANIGNARLAGMEKSLHMEGLDFNLLLSVFYMAYIVFALPSTMLCKVVGPRFWLPSIAIGFGISSLATAFVHTLRAAWATRFFLGASEAGALPSISFYLSRWYRRDELAFRLSLYIVSAPLAGAWGGLLASAILKIDHIGWLRDWRLIYFCEGIATVGVGAVAFFLLSDSPQTAGWLTPEEKMLAVTRMLQDVKGTASQTTDHRIRLPQVKRGIFCVTTLSLCFAFMMNNIIVQGLAFFLPTIIRTLYPGRTIIQQQLLTVPPWIAGSISTLVVPYLSMKTRHRSGWIIMSALFAVIGFAVYTGTHARDAKARYTASFFVCIGSFLIGPILQGWASGNQTEDSSRAAAIGTTVTAGNIGGFIACWTFLLRDAPDYHSGNAINLACACGIVVSVACLGAYLWRENGRRDAGDRDELLVGLSEEDKENLGHLHPAFRYCL
ncbi:putative pantothenate transporter [Jaminaea rosea]|uniref:Putative pantothenate transporter n=1 Tax=Jaminaea rosea TaxID=1569628 RepID=A0A316USL0_9BASI|nr:putative pantothenate transporter [Jaminaea rosea]PWN28286.1 putative pantothenate transporter [Jaminaea rosea]